MDVPQEIERKFIVRPGIWPVSALPVHIVQGYLSPPEGPSVRVRLVGNKARLTIKQTSRDPSQGRAEFEYDIPPDHARFMLDQLCPQSPVEKLRHSVSFGGHHWVIDEFLGSNAGLILAEIETKHPQQSLPLPIWVQQEVSRDRRFHNSYLYRHPWSQWEATDKNLTLPRDESSFSTAHR